MGNKGGKMKVTKKDAEPEPAKTGTEESKPADVEATQLTTADAEVDLDKQEDTPAVDAKEESAKEGDKKGSGVREAETDKKDTSENTDQNKEDSDKKQDEKSENTESKSETETKVDTEQKDTENKVSETKESAENKEAKDIEQKDTENKVSENEEDTDKQEAKDTEQNDTENKVSENKEDTENHEAKSESVTDSKPLESEIKTEESEEKQAIESKPEDSDKTEKVEESVKTDATETTVEPENKEQDAANTNVAVVKPLLADTCTDDTNKESSVPVIADSNDSETVSTEKENDLSAQSPSVEATETILNEDKAEGTETQVVQNSDVTEAKSEKESEVDETNKVNVEQVETENEKVEMNGESLQEDTVTDSTEKSEPPAQKQTEELEEKIATEFRWEDAGESVEVAGSFNDWGDKVKLDKKDDAFVISIDLLPGEYTYKYFVDGDWKINNNQPKKTGDDDVENNFIAVTKG